MAKSKAPTFYCKWCEEILKGDCKFCSEPCRKIWNKTRDTPTEQIIQNHQDMVDALKTKRLDISGTCKEVYLDNKKTLARYTGSVVVPLFAETKLYCYIYNKNKDKAFQAFEKLKQIHQENIDAVLFEGKNITLGILQDEGVSHLTGEESFRVNGILVKLLIQKFELMLEQTFS